MIKKLKAYLEKIGLEAAAQTKVATAIVTVSSLLVVSILGTTAYEIIKNIQPAAEDTEAAEEVVMETEISTEDGFASQTVNVPMYTACEVSSDSLYQDLDLYVTNEEDTKIAGINFTIKLVDPDDAESLSQYLDPLAELNDQIEIYSHLDDGTYGEDDVKAALSDAGYEYFEAPTLDEILAGASQLDYADMLEELISAQAEGTSEASNAASNATSTGNSANNAANEANESAESAADSASGTQVIEVSSMTGEPLTQCELLLVEKEALLNQYSTALAALSGDEYTDDDADGHIYIEEIDGGDYVACFEPTMSYDAEDYALDVTVKNELEYTPVVNIEQKTVEDAGDEESTVEHEEVEVEEEIVDTVEWVESSKVGVPGEYTVSTPKTLKSSVSSSTNSTSGTCSVTVPATTSLLDSRYSGITYCTQNSGTQDSESQTSGTETQNSQSGTQGSETQSTQGSDTESTQGSGTTTKEYDYSATLSKTATVYSCGEYTANTATLIYQFKNFQEGSSVTFTSSDTSVLTVPSDPLIVSSCKSTATSCNITVTAVTGIKSDKTVTVTATGKNPAGEDVTVKCTVTVKGSSTALTDSDGRQLYVKSTKNGEDTYTEATYADYSTSTTFYYQSKEPSYTYYGWNTINNIQYYFDKNGNAVTGEQVIQGVMYEFGTDGALLTSGLGIDVSKWNGSIDWAQASSMIDFAIIRCGYRGRTSRELSEDPYVDSNMKNAHANGVKIGLYFYSTALTEAQAVEEASLAVAIANRNGNVSLPIYIDMEDNLQKDLTTAERDAIVIAFCQTVANAGYRPGVYANKNWLTHYLTPSSYSGYSIWCAQYNTTCTYSGRYDIWQYTSTGTCPGVGGSVDWNRSYF